VSPGAAAVSVENDLRGGHGVGFNEDSRVVSSINEECPEKTGEEYVDAQIWKHLGKTPLFMVSRNVVEGGVD
jgi:hypothetical protein